MRDMHQQQKQQQNTEKGLMMTDGKKSKDYFFDFLNKLFYLFLYSIKEL